MLSVLIGCGSSSNSGAGQKSPTTPTITWAPPSAIVYGTALSATQLNATASVPGSFAYSPAAGTVLGAGTQTLSVTFTPSDTTNYTSAQASVSFTVTRATPAITWATPASVVYGTALSATQLNATASVSGSFAYSPASGTFLGAGTQTLSVSFTPTDTTDYASAQSSVSLTVAKASPTITWASPSAIVYGTALSTTQLNATASVPGSFVYSPASGTVFGAGTQPLSATFTPTDAADYASSTANVSLVIDKALPLITWATPASIAVGSSVSSTQLNATATGRGSLSGSTVAGSFAYTPASGTTETVPGNLTLQTIFTPTDTTDYMSAAATNTLTLTTAGPTYSWTNVTIEGGGYVDGVYFHPLQQNLEYVKDDIGGAYRWNQNTGSWVPLLDWIKKTQGDYFGTDYWGLGSLAIDPTDAQYLYLAVGVGTSGQNGTLLISHDQGNTFTNVTLPFAIESNNNGRSADNRMAVDPNLPSRIYYGTILSGLWYSDNRGLTWTQSSSFPTLNTTNKQGIVFVLPVASSGTAGSLSPLIFAGVAESPTSGSYDGLYYSTNAGVTWMAMPNQISGSYLPWRGRLGPNNELYVNYNNGIGPNGVTAAMVVSYAYTNGGSVSAPTNITPTISCSSGGGIGDIEPDPEIAGALIASTIDCYNGSTNSDLIYRSVNDGSTWVSFSNDTHNLSSAIYVDYHNSNGVLYNHDGNWINMAVDPFNSNHVVYGTGQMIYSTTNVEVANTGGSVSWVEQALGEEEWVVNSLAAPKSGSTLLLSGVDDLGGFASTSLTSSPSTGQLLSVTPQTNTSIDFSEANPSYVVRVGGNNGQSASSAPYGGYSTNAPSTWTAFSTPLSSTKGSGTIAVAADGSTLVWSPYDVGVAYSTNNGSTWTASTGAPQSSSQVVISDRANASNFYIYTGGTGLYESTNYGANFALVAGTGVGSTGTAYSSFAYAGDVWIAGSSGLYRNTSSSPSTSIVMTQVAGFNKGYLVAFGVPQSGSGFNDTIYVYGNRSGVDGIFRSVDNGTTWQIITDQQHQFGDFICMAADRRTFGTLYLGTYARGVIVGTSTY